MGAKLLWRLGIKKVKKSREACDGILAYFPQVSDSCVDRSSNSHTAAPSKAQRTPFAEEEQFHCCGTGSADLNRNEVVAAKPLHSLSAVAWAWAMAKD
jgi:phage terminase large subunit-like protein